MHLSGVRLSVPLGISVSPWFWLQRLSVQELSRRRLEARVYSDVFLSLCVPSLCLLQMESLCLYPECIVKSLLFL